MQYSIHDGPRINRPDASPPYFWVSRCYFVCGILEYVRDQGIDRACVASRPEIGKMDQATAAGGFFSTCLNVVYGIL